MVERSALIPARSQILQTQRPFCLKSNLTSPWSVQLCVNIRAEISKDNVTSCISKSWGWWWDGGEVSGEGVGGVSLWPLNTNKDLSSTSASGDLFGLVPWPIKFKMSAIGHRQPANPSLSLDKVASNVCSINAGSAAVQRWREAHLLPHILIFNFSLKAT